MRRTPSAPTSLEKLPRWFSDVHHCGGPLFHVRRTYSWLACSECQYSTLDTPAAPTWHPHWTALEAAVTRLSYLATADPHYDALRELVEGPGEVRNLFPACGNCYGNPPLGFQCLICRRKGAGR